MSGFLDDKLYDHVKSQNIEKTEDFQKMLNELYRICEDHWQPESDVNKGPQHLKTLLDRTFSSWNLFITRIKKDNYLFSGLLEEYSYKFVFMDNKETSRIYKTLK